MQNPEEARIFENQKYMVLFLYHEINSGNPDDDMAPATA